MNLFRPILGLGFLAGAAIAAVKLVHLYDRVQDGEWTAVMGEVPEEEYTVPAPPPEESAETPEKPAEPAGEEVAEPAEKPEEPAAEMAALEEEAAVPEDAHETEQKAPERVTVRPRRARIDPTTIARAEDFQDWDDFGCRG